LRRASATQIVDLVQTTDYFAQQFLDFLPLPHRQGSLRPTFVATTIGFCGCSKRSKSPTSSGLSGSMLTRHSHPCFSKIAVTSLHRASDCTRTTAGFLSLPSLAVFFKPKVLIRRAASTLLRIVPMSVIRLLIGSLFQLLAQLAISGALPVSSSREFIAIKIGTMPPKKYRVWAFDAFVVVFANVATCTSALFLRRSHSSRPWPVYADRVIPRR